MISETFNEFFCNIGSKLANKFSNNNIEAYKTYLNHPADQSLLLYQINKEEIKVAISQLKIVTPRVMMKLLQNLSKYLPKF